MCDVPVESMIVADVDRCRVYSVLPDDKPLDYVRQWDTLFVYAPPPSRTLIGHCTY